MSNSIEQNKSEDDIVTATVRLSEAEAEELLLRVSEIAGANLPLSLALEKMGQSVASGPLQQAIAATAKQLELGRDLSGALKHTQRALPLHLTGLVAASLRSGNCYNFLQSTLELRSQLRQEWADFRSSITYPAFMALVSLCVLVIMVNTIGSVMYAMINDFGLEIPSVSAAALESAMWFTERGQYACLGILLGGIVAVVVGKFCLPSRVWQRFVKGWPILGTIFQSAAHAEFSQLLGLLVAEQIPLASAVRLAGQATRQGDIASAAERIASRLEAGNSPALAWRDESATFSNLWSTFVEHGVQLHALPESLSSLSCIYLEQMQARCRFIRHILPPLTFILIAISALGMIGSTFLPMISLIQGLSGSIVSVGTFGSGKLHPLNLLALLLPILGIMMVRRMLFRQYAGINATLMETFFHMLEWRLFLLLFFGSLAIAGLFSIPLFVLALAIFIYGSTHYFAMHKRLLLQRLAVCGEANIPLPQALQLCAEELPATMQRRAMLAADYLGKGTSLLNAFDRAWIFLPYEYRFAISAASATNTFGKTLHQGLALENRTRDSQMYLFGRLVYLWGLVFGLISILTFVMLKIIPVFSRMFEEFGVDLPAMTQLVIKCSANFANYAFVFIPGMIFLGIALMIFIDPLVSRIIAWPIPWVHLLWINKHGAVLLRGISAMLHRNCTLPQALFVATTDYPVSIISRQMHKAGESLSRGGSWTEALRQYGFISGYDSAILTAAEKAGNLPWAMEEVADHAERRLGLRISWIANILFPLCLVLLSIMVAFIAIGLMIPLIALTQAMAGAPRG